MEYGAEYGACLNGIQYAVIPLFEIVFSEVTWPRLSTLWIPLDRKSTRLNSSHQIISYAVFCLKKKNATLSRCSGGHLAGLQRSVHKPRTPTRGQRCQRAIAPHTYLRKSHSTPPTNTVRDSVA